MNNKTLLLSEIFPPLHGGSGRWFWELYNRLQKDDYLIAAGDHSKAAEFDKHHDLNIERLSLSSKSWGFASLTGIKFYLHSFIALRKLIKQHNIKVIHCGRCLPEGVIGLLLSHWFKIPLVSFIHGEDIETASLSRELSILVNLVVKKANLLICNSQNTANLLHEKWNVDPKKIQVLNPGVDADKFVPTPLCRESREKLDWTNKKVILTVGRLQKRKGHDMMINAMPKIIEHIPNACYAIVGSGEELANLKQRTSELGINNNVQFIGEIGDNDLLSCYQQSDLFILPNRTEGSDIEGFGMVLVEAQSCGKAVIAGNSGGTRETMLLEKTGFIIDCTDPENISQKIVELLSDDEKRNSMGKEARKHVEATLDWKAHTEKAKLLFSSVSDK